MSISRRAWSIRRALSAAAACAMRACSARTSSAPWRFSASSSAGSVFIFSLMDASCADAAAFISAAVTRSSRI
jgi:hypothetical protein